MLSWTNAGETSVNVTSAVTSSIIGPSPGNGFQGRGTARLRSFGENTLFSERDVTVYSDFADAIPVGTHVLISPDGDDYRLLSADCPVA
jgi:hypothetical protein